jgi:hypothetical protein
VIRYAVDRNLRPAIGACLAVCSSAAGRSKDHHLF